MTIDELEVKFSVDTAGASKDVQSFSEELKGVGETTEETSSSMGDSLSAIAGAVASAFSLSAIKSFAVELIKLSDIQYMAEKKFETVASNRMGMTEAEIDSFKQYASELQSVSVFGDEATLSVAALMGGILGSNEAVTELLPSVQDLTAFIYGASASTQNYEKVSRDMARAVETGSLSMLEEQGIFLSTEYQAAWDAATSAEERSAIMAQYVQETYGNMSETVAATPTGQITQLSNAFGDLKEMLGTYLAPVVSFVTGLLMGLVSWCQEHTGLVFGLIAALAILVGIIALVTLVTTIQKGVLLAWNVIVGIATAVTAVWGAVTAAAGVAFQILTSPITLIILAIAALIAIIVLCIVYWDEIKAVAIQVWNNIKAKVQEVINNIKQKFEELKTNAINKFNEIKTGVVNKVVELKTNVVNKFNEVKEGVINKFNELKAGITGILESIIGVVTGIVERIKNAFSFNWSLPTFSGGGGTGGTNVSSYHAKGGVFDSPKLFGYGGGRLGVLGEAGAEAVVPLENNTEWLDRIAERLNSGNNSSIIMAAANMIVSAINNKDNSVYLDGMELANGMYNANRTVNNRVGKAMVQGV